MVIGLLVKAKVSDMCLSTCCQATANVNRATNISPKKRIHIGDSVFSRPASLENTPCMEFTIRLRWSARNQRMGTSSPLFFFIFRMIPLLF